MRERRKREKNYSYTFEGRHWPGMRHCVIILNLSLALRHTHTHTHPPTHPHTHPHAHNERFLMQGGTWEDLKKFKCTWPVFHWRAKGWKKTWSCPRPFFFRTRLLSRFFGFGDEWENNSGGLENWNRRKINGRKNLLVKKLAVLFRFIVKLRIIKSIAAEKALNDLMTSIR